MEKGRSLRSCPITQPLARRGAPTSGPMTEQRGQVMEFAHQLREIGDVEHLGMDDGAKPAVMRARGI